MRESMQRLLALLLALIMVSSSMFAALAEGKDTVTEYSESTSVMDIITRADATHVPLYVCIDREWESIGALLRSEGKDSNNRYYVSNADVRTLLESNNIPFIPGSYHFGHETESNYNKGSGSVWYDVAAADGGNGNIYVGTSNTTTYVMFYIPRQDSQGNISWNDTALIDNNTFYTVTLQDEEGNGLSTLTYMLAAEETTINFPSAEEKYELVTADGNVVHVASPGEEYTLKAEQVNQPYIIRPARDLRLTLQANGGSWTVGLSANTNLQKWLETEADNSYNLGGLKWTLSAYNWTLENGTSITADIELTDDTTIVGELKRYTLSLITDKGAQITDEMPYGTNVKDWLDKQEPDGRVSQAYAWTYAGGKPIGANDVLTGDVSLVGTLITHSIGLTTDDGTRITYTVETGTNIRQWLDDNKTHKLDNGKFIASYNWKYNDGEELAEDSAFTEDVELKGELIRYTVTLEPEDANSVSFKVDSGVNLRTWLNSISSLPLSNGELISSYDWVIWTEAGDLNVNQLISGDTILKGTMKDILKVTFQPGGGSFSGGNHEYAVYRGARLTEANINQQTSLLVKPDDMAFVGWYFYTLDYDNPAETVPQDRTDYMLFTSGTSVVENMVVVAAYDTSCTVTYYTDSSMTEILAIREIPYAKTLNSVEGSSPTDEEMAAAGLPPEERVLDYWVDGLDPLAAAFSPNEIITGDLKLYPTFRRYNFVFVDEEGNNVFTVPLDDPIYYGMGEIPEGKYFDGLTIRNGNDTVWIPFDTMASADAFEALGVNMPQAENGSYVFTVAETLLLDQHTIVYHSDEESVLNNADANGVRREIVQRETELLTGLDIYLTVNSASRALKGWQLEDGTYFMDEGALLTDEELAPHWDENGELHLYPVWETDKSNCYEVVFHFQYPTAEEDGAEYADGQPTRTEYTAYVPKQSSGDTFATMPTQAQALYVIPTNIVVIDGKEELRFVTAGWSTRQSGEDSTKENGVYQEGVQHLTALKDGTNNFYLRWIDRAEEVATSQKTVQFFIRDDGTYPQEPDTDHSSKSYFPVEEGNSTTYYAKDVLYEEVNVVNDLDKVKANIKEEPSKQEVWNDIVEHRDESGTLSAQTLERIRSAAEYSGVTDWKDDDDWLKDNYALFEQYWWVQWYAIKYVSSAWHVDGRIVTAQTVTLNYNANGGVYVPASQIAVQEADGSYPEVRVQYKNDKTYPQRSNFTFVGWSEDPDDSPYQNDDSIYYKDVEEYITLSKDVTTLYAVWKPNIVAIPQTGPFQGVKKEQTRSEELTTPATENLPYYSFHIELVEYSGDYLDMANMPWEDSVTLTTDNEFAFDQYEVSVPGLYRFEIWEDVNAAKPEIQFDDSVYELTILVVETDYGLEIKSYTFYRDGVKLETTTGSFSNFTPVFEFVNRLGQRDITVEKVWEDQDNQEALRPRNLTVNLLRDGTQVDTAILNATNGWTYTWEDLESVNGTQAYRYTVEEKLAADSPYISATTGNMSSGYVITNTYAPRTISMVLYKYWEDEGYEAQRPENIKVTINGYDSRGARKFSREVTMDGSSGFSQANMWYWRIDGLPMYMDGAPLSYMVDEGLVENYDSKLDILAESDDGELKSFKITNTVRQASITVTKNVSGNMGLKDTSFSFTGWLANNADGTVIGPKPSTDGSYDVLEDGTITFRLKHGESITLKDIPANTTLTLTEDSQKHTVTYQCGDESISGDMATFSVQDGMTINVTNHKEAEIATGVQLDAAPYWLLLGMSLTAWLLLKQKRRTE